MAGGVALVPGWLAEAAQAATPIGPNDGIVVLLTMNGGNDSLSTIIPIADGTYHDQRRGLAIAPGSAIALTDERALHPALTTVNHLWHKGDVAIIDGVGIPGSANLSHFSSMGQIMAGTSGSTGTRSGWLGRYLDGLPGGDDPFHGVSIGRSIPLVAQGQRRRASGLPPESNGVFQVEGADPTYRRQYDAVAAFAAASTGRGELADALALNGREAVGIAAQIEPLYSEELPEGDIKAKLEIAARLINANLGIRVLTVSYGDFDSHARQPEMHNARMAELNDGLAAFHNRLRPSFAARTVVLALSEFGRRVKANSSDGTDHGAAGSMLVIGSQVRGGFYGELPSLTSLDRQGNLKPTVDFRSVYATMLDGWLGADANQILGGRYEDLGFLAPPSPARTTRVASPAAANAVFKHRAQVVRLYRAYFGRLPDSAGLDHWVAARRSGLSLARVSEALAGSAEFQARYGALSNRQFTDLVYRNVLGRAPDPAGLDYWTASLDGGARRGDVMIGFSESTEFVSVAAADVERVDNTGPVARLYLAYFLRPGDADGLAHWIGAGLSYAAVSDAFAASTEFSQRYGNLSDSDFVELVYRNVLGRAADAHGQEHWLSRLNAGTSRGTVMLGFSESPEFVARTGTIG